MGRNRGYLERERSSSKRNPVVLLLGQDRGHYSEVDYFEERESRILLGNDRPSEIQIVDWLRTWID